MAKQSEKNGKIGVVVSCYKVEKTLDRCIQSILNQSYDNFELVLVDNASPDTSGEICENYKKSDNRIVTLHNEINRGPGGGRNTAIEYLVQNNKCEWIIFIDADDFINERYFETLVEVALLQSTEIVWSFLYNFSSEEDIPLAQRKEKPRRYTDIEMVWCKYARFATYVLGKMFKLSFFYELRFPEKGLDDERTTHKAFFAAKSISVIPLYEYYYYINPNSYMHSTWSAEKKDDQLMAVFEKLGYFYKNGYKNAFKRYLKFYAELIRSSSQVDDVAADYQEVIKKHIRQYNDITLIYPKCINRVCWSYINFIYFQRDDGKKIGNLLKSYFAFIDKKYLYTGVNWIFIPFFFIYEIMLKVTRSSLLKHQ